jgi:hypothetical protein
MHWATTEASNGARSGKICKYRNKQDNKLGKRQQNHVQRTEIESSQEGKGGENRSIHLPQQQTSRTS